MEPGFAGVGAALLTTDPAELREALSDEPELRAALPEDAEDIEREFVRLFLRPRGDVLSLWQSAYEEPRQLMGPAHDSALGWYRRYGWEPRCSHEPADHAGLLLEFYAFLVETGAEPAELEAFRVRHLDWLGPWVEQVTERSRLEFYRAVGERAAGLLRHLPARICRA